jgi:hypothetical protein
LSTGAAERNLQAHIQHQVLGARGLPVEAVPQLGAQRDGAARDDVGQETERGIEVGVFVVGAELPVLYVPAAATQQVGRDAFAAVEDVHEVDAETPVVGVIQALELVAEGVELDVPGVAEGVSNRQCGAYVVVGQPVIVDPDNRGHRGDVPLPGLFCRGCGSAEDEACGHDPCDHYSFHYC